MKKQLIIEKALELFAEQGIEATSVQQITERCGISKGAFYLSFKSKDELILSLIDSFMTQITAEIDHTVSTTEDKKELPYQYYLKNLEIFTKYASFTKLFMNEQTHSNHHDLLLKLEYYDHMISQSILKMLDRIYGDDIAMVRYDLLVCIKIFTPSFCFMHFRYCLPVDMERLARSLAEKTDILAAQMTKPYFKGDEIYFDELQLTENLTKEELADLTEFAAEKVSDEMVKDSLGILKDNILSSDPRMAIVKGMLENIKNHPECKVVYSKVRRHFHL